MSKRVGYQKEPIISFIDFDHCVIDVLHLHLRISDQLLTLLVSILNENDPGTSSSLEERPNLKKYLDFLQNDCKITKPFYFKKIDNETTIKVRNLSGKERNKIFEEMYHEQNMTDLFPNLENRLENLNFIFYEYYSLLSLIKKFGQLRTPIDLGALEMRSLACWCKFNKLDINWSKTFAMFITKKRIELPQNILVLGNKISIVKSFKLLGITIDNKLSFINYVSQLRITVNKKLFSIKNLFNLPTAVKLQFFKSFIMPHYDYCSTLFIYFNKDAIQKLVNSYNICLNKLLGLKLIINNTNDYNNLNNVLESYGLSNFQHRVCPRMMVFTQKLLKAKNNESGPKLLTQQLTRNSELEKGYNLRNNNQIATSQISNLNNYGTYTFEYIYCRFANSFCTDETDISIAFFKTRAKNNINLIFTKFVQCCPKFDLNYKSSFHK